MFDAVTLWKYGGIVGTLILSGFGLPVPEEIPIVTAGAMVGNDARELAEYRRLDNASDEFAELADPAGGLTIFFASDRIGNGNGSHYANPDVDKMLADALATGDDAQRATLYDQVVRQLITDVAALPAFHKKLVLAAKASVDMDSLHTNAEGYPNFYDVGFLS